MIKTFAKTLRRKLHRSVLVFGKNEFPHNRVYAKAIVKASVPSWIIYAVVYAVYHGSEVIIPDMFYGGRVPGDGIDALALIFCGLPNRYVTAQPLLWDIVHGWVKPAPLPSLYPIARIVSFVNYYQLYSWSYDYLVNPEPDRKFKFYLRGVIIILAGMTGLEILRFLFYQVCKTAWISGVMFYISLHLVGCIIALVAYYDDKRHRKWMAGYRE